MPRKKRAEGGHETNAELIGRLMEFSKSGALTQLFIIEAVRRYALTCSQAAPERMDVGFISGAAWKRTAEELRGELERHLGE